MASPSKPSNARKSTGSKDIKSFFTGGSQRSASGSQNTPKGVSNASKQKSKAGTSSNRAIEISDSSDSEVPPVSKPRVSEAAKPKHQARKSNTKMVIDTDSESPPPKVASTSKKRKDTESFEDDDDDDFMLDKPSASKKRKSVASSSDEDEEDEVPSRKKPMKTQASKESATSKPKLARKPPPKKKDDDFIVPDDEEEKEVSKKKPAPNWAAIKAAKLSGPANPGGKAVPNGKPNCLANLCFVFTGELSSFSREEAQDIVKRYGGRYVGAPSKKTDYVVLGEGAGPKKLEIVKKLGVKTLDEDGFLNLVATREGVLDDKTKDKMRKEEAKIREAAAEMEKREKDAVKEAKKAGTSTNKQNDPSMTLWTTKYAPTNLKEICGNKGIVEKLHLWLSEWEKSRKDGFRKPGKNGGNMYRAALLSGPPGIGKTTAAHLVAEACGYSPIEVNASDARSKKLVESSTNITNRSLDGWLHGGAATNVVDKNVTGKPLLIMDEVDGMSAGDRGGVGALNALIKKTEIPIICIANDRRHPKMKPLLNTTFDLTYRKPTPAEIRSRIMSIAYKEKLKMPGAVVDQLVQSSGSDIRQVLNMMSTWKLTHDTMDFDQSKELSAMNEKYQILTPFNLLEKLVGPYTFSSTNRQTLNDKMDYYFQDFSMVPLFIQENYLKTHPNKLRGYSGTEEQLKRLELMDKAASAISDGDLIDSMIHSSEQHWSLMPLHAINSTIRPAIEIAGPGGGYGGPNAMSFPSWLGNNSKEGKLRRQLGDIQIRMRLKVSGDKNEIRQTYIPALYPTLIKPLVEDGADAIPDVIQRMDDYYLSREEWDSIVELGVGDRSDGVIMKKIDTKTKTAFTKRYNLTDHPVAFHKATIFGNVKRGAGGPAPDLEDVFDVDEEEEEVKDEGDEEDLSKDKLIKQAKKKAAPKGKGKN